MGNMLDDCCKSKNRNGNKELNVDELYDDGDDLTNASVSKSNHYFKFYLHCSS